MSKHISRTKSIIRFRDFINSDIEQMLTGENMASIPESIKKDILRRREEFRKRQEARRAQWEAQVAKLNPNHPKAAPATVVEQKFENEYEAFVKQMKVKKATKYCDEHNIQGEMRNKLISLEMTIDEYEKICQTVTETTEAPTVSEVNNESENIETVQPSEEEKVVEVKPKKTRKKKQVAETVSE